MNNLHPTKIINKGSQGIVLMTDNNDLVVKLKNTDTDLLNIRDEMLAELNQLLYLFTLT
jgi:hypothetical protein